MSLVSGEVHVQSRVSGYDAGVASDWNWDFHGSLEKCTSYVEKQIAEDVLYGLEDESEYRIIDDSDEVLLEWKNGRMVR